MNPFTTVQRKKALVWLSLFHLRCERNAMVVFRANVNLACVLAKWG
jgi:hypothetical protein